MGSFFDRPKISSTLCTGCCRREAARSAKPRHLRSRMSEQRKGTRAPVDIYVNKYVSGVPYMARAKDIGPDGVRLNTLIEPEHQGKRVGLQFQLPGSEEV